MLPYHIIRGRGHMQGKKNEGALVRLLTSCLLFLIVLFLPAVLAGCKKDKKTEIVLTTDFEQGEVFRIENSSCMLPEIMVYLVNSENQYDQIFGSEIWQVPVEDGTMEQEYKETIIARIAQIKVMNLLAAQYETELSGEEEEKVAAAAREYFSSLNSSEIALMGVDEATIEQLYHEFAVADKLYHVITDEVNPEISDDEARTITVKSILVKTYSTDSQGNKAEFTENQKQSAYERIREVVQKLNDGEDFDVLAADYNEDTQLEYSFGRGVMPAAYEEAAFNLETGQISGIIETEYGYHVLQCVSTFNQEETDANKQAIVAKRRQEAFNQVYDEYVKTLTSNLNAPLWESVTYQKNENVNTTSFFTIYDKYFVVAAG